jgi:NADPH:quinone reductase-like Zn-dependent oxidoreductase
MIKIISFAFDLHAAAVAWGPAQPLVVEEILVDPPQKMEVRIKIHFTSICQTDLGVWLGKVLIRIDRSLSSFYHYHYIPI